MGTDLGGVTDLSRHGWNLVIRASRGGMDCCLCLPDDVVVLPGMVVPLELGDGEVRAAVEAAQAGESGGADQARVLLVPRLDDKYATVGTVGVIEQVGRLRGGEHAAVERGTARAKIGSAARPRWLAR
jgi:ATP-dependent Lon protease